MSVDGQDITIFAGETLVITDTVRRKSTGALEDFTGASSIIFTLEQNGTEILTKTLGVGITANSSGVVTITLTAANTAGLRGDYQWELRATLADTTVTTTTTGAFTVRPTITG